MYFIDSHCHLNLLPHNKSKNQIKYIINKIYKKNIKLILNISTSIKDYKESFNLFKKYPYIFYSLGIHPLYKNIHKINFMQFKNILKKEKKIIAIGETGLDFYRSYTSKIYQIKSFKKHIEYSIKFNKPIIIHTRNSISTIIKILSIKKFNTCKGVIHSFIENINMLKKIIDLGLYVSFSGIITFKNAKHLNRIVKFTPLDRLLIETDSPYLSPEPFRGIINIPSNLIYTAKHISKLKNISLQHLSEITNKNFYQLFNIQNTCRKLLKC